MSTKPVRHESKDTQRTAGRRVDFAKTPQKSASEKPVSHAPEQEHAPAPEPIAPPSNLPTPEEAAGDPLVKAVLEVFDGTVKQVYPRK